MWSWQLRPDMQGEEPAPFRLGRARQCLSCDNRPGEGHLWVSGPHAAMVRLVSPRGPLGRVFFVGRVFHEAVLRRGGIPRPPVLLCWWPNHHSHDGSFFHQVPSPPVRRAAGPPHPLLGTGPRCPGSPSSPPPPGAGPRWCGSPRSSSAVRSAFLARCRPCLSRSRLGPCCARGPPMGSGLVQRGRGSAILPPLPLLC